MLFFLFIRINLYRFLPLFFHKALCWWFDKRVSPFL